MTDTTDAADLIARLRDDYADRSGEGPSWDAALTLERVTRERDEALSMRDRVAERASEYVKLMRTDYVLKAVAEARIAKLEADNARMRMNLTDIKADLPYVMGWGEGFDHAFSETLRFPTMLRKMWSGSEIQSWLDEQRKIAMAGREEKP